MYKTLMSVQPSRVVGAWCWTEGEKTPKNSAIKMGKISRDKAEGGRLAIKRSDTESGKGS